MSMFWHLSNRRYDSQAGDASSAARKATTSVEELENRLERSMLACEAMWSSRGDKLGGEVWRPSKVVVRTGAEDESDSDGLKE